jgi:hypothetical protein
MATKQIGSKQWQKTNSTTSAAFSPYKPFKEQITSAVKSDGRAMVTTSWLALRSIVRATVGEDAPKWSGMDDSALEKRIGMKNLAWAHVADAWGANLGGVAFMIDASDPHYVAVRAAALAFRAAVTGKMPGALHSTVQAPTLCAKAHLTESIIKSALVLALSGGN